ncbi:MAG TPA: hypothetical protein VFF69_00080 [Phycisphaerales bacterium]|nr:hypothetical protein [Phycisphaerales bacterium]
MMEPERPASNSSTARRRRRRRRGLLGVVVLAIALALPLLLTRSPLTKRLVLPALESELGARVTAARVVIEPDATIVVTDLRILARGLPGPAGEILGAERAEIRTTWGSLLSGSALVREMTFVRPRLRVSRDAATGAINLSEIEPPVSDEASMQPLPLIVVRDGAIELGEHLGERYDLLRTLRVEGSLRPTPDPEHLGYMVSFAEGDVSDQDGEGLALMGRVTPDGVTLTLEGLLLSEWRPENIPTEYREVFEVMGIEGAVPRSAMSFSPEGATLFRIELDGVSLNLPFDAQGRPAEPGNLVRLRDVTGIVEVSDQGADAKLTGTLGDLPSSVHLVYRGLRADSPFRCDITTAGFQLRSNPELLPLAPGIVVRRLADFSNPTATVDASITVERGEPTPEGPGAIQVRGEMAFRDGTAAFRDFPYAFHDMEGLATFDERKIEIVRVTARADSGAVLSAHGTIAPPLPGAAVDIKVHVENLPIDDTLLAAMGEQRRRIVQSVFSRERYERLLERGFVRRPGSEPREPGGPPEFELGGPAVVDIHVVRAEGAHTGYNEVVEVFLEEAGVVAQPFPLPIVARNVKIEIGGDEARVVRGEFSGLGGGSAALTGSVDLKAPDERGIKLSIDAKQIPTDELLLAALPGGLDSEPQPHAPSAVLRRLGVRGLLDCAAEVGARETGELGYDIRVGFAGLRARPAHLAGDDASPVSLRGAEGELLVSERALSLRLDARVAGADADPIPGSAESRLTVEAEMTTSGEERALRADVAATLADVGLAVEDLVGVVAPDMAARLGELRREMRPSGGVELRTHAEGVLGDEPALSRLDVAVLACRDLEFETEPGRLRVASRAGTLGLSALRPDTVQFDGFEAELSLGGEAPTLATLSGAYPVGRPWRQGDDLALGLRGARLDAALVRRSMESSLPRSLAAAMEKADVQGVFDADVRILGLDGKPKPRVTGELRPERCALTLRGQRITMSSMEGGILLDETGGSLEGFSAEGQGWRARVGGTWVAVADGAMLLNGTISGASEQGLTPEVRALLPEGLRGALEAVSISAGGPISAEGLSIRLSLDEQRGSAYRTAGRVVFEGASAEAGVEIQNASGYLDFEAESVPGSDLGNFGVGVILDRFRAAGINLRDGAMRIASDPRARIVTVPVIVADAYGGRLSGSVAVSLHDASPPTYEADLRLSGAPLGELLADWEHAAGIERAAAENERPPQRPRAESRGMVDAGLRLTGVAGENGTRRGRGTIHVGGGEDTEVLRLPLLLPLIQVSNLQIPQNDRLDFGEAVFFLEGDHVVFERVGVFAESVEIFGFGQMDLPGMNLDLRFNSRATNRLPLVSKLVENFRNELITTRVTGAVADPDISVVQFSRTRRLVSAATGRELSPEEQRMLEIERLSRESAQRERRVGRSGSAGQSSTPAGGD